MKYVIYVSLFFIGSLVGFSCTNEDGISFDNPNGSKSPNDNENGYTRTVLVYMVESNLGTHLQKNIESMKDAATKKNLNGGHLVVFHSESDKKSELFEIKEGPDEVPTKYPIKDFSGKSALSKKVMREVIDSVLSRYPSDSYAMVLSSHGTAWLPQGYSGMLRSFGEENGYNMEIGDLADALPDNLFDFLLFDACSMGSIECVYELKDKADFIVSSPSETMVAGFPYKDILSYFYTKEPNLDKVAEGFYKYYRDKAQHRYGNVSVVNTKELEGLKNSVQEILSDKSEADWFALPEENMQLLSYLPESPVKLYDFEDVIKYMATAEQYTRFSNSLNKAVTSKYYTPYIYCSRTDTNNHDVKVERFSGLSIYPLRENRTQLNDRYRLLDWYKAVF